MYSTNEHCSIIFTIYSRSNYIERTTPNLYFVVLLLMIVTVMHDASNCETDVAKIFSHITVKSRSILSFYRCINVGMEIKI